MDKEQFGTLIAALNRIGDELERLAEYINEVIGVDKECRTTFVQVRHVEADE